MHTKTFRLLAIGLAAFLAGCSSPTSTKSDSTPAATPAPTAVPSTSPTPTPATSPTPTPATSPTPTPATTPLPTNLLDIFDQSSTSGFTTLTATSGGTVTVTTAGSILTAVYGETTGSGQYGGFYFVPAGTSAPSAAGFANGELVFTIDTSAMPNTLAHLQIKVASGTYPAEAGGEVDLFTLTPSSISGTAKTYKIPMGAFTVLAGETGGTPNWANLTTFAGFWNPTDASGNSLDGTVKLSNVYFQPTNDLTLTSLTAVSPSVTVVVGATSTVAVTAAYSNGSSGALNNTTLSNWQSTPGTGTSSVTSAGVITGLTAGTSTVTATLGTQTVTVNVTVTATLVPLGVYSNTYASNSVKNLSLTGNTFSNSAGGTDVTVAYTSAVAAEDGGTQVIGLTVPGGAGDWSGAAISFNPVDVHSFSSLVISVNTSAVPTAASMICNLEDTSTKQSAVNLANYTGVTSAGWTTYTIPISAFTGLDLTKVGYLVLGNVQDSSSVYLGGTVYFDNIYFKP